MEYKEYFKYLLSESPDNIDVEGEVYSWDDNGYSTMLYYNDLRSGRKEWVSVQHGGGNYDGVLSSNNDVVNEIDYYYGNTKKASDPSLEELRGAIGKRYSVSPIEAEKWLINEKRGWRGRVASDDVWQFVHRHLASRLIKSFRLDEYYEREYVDIAARMYDTNEGIIFTCWNYRHRVKEHQSVVMDYLRKLNLTPKFIKYQSNDMDDNEYMDYYEFFGEKPSRELSDYEKQQKELAQQLHINKAQLDQAIVRAIEGYKESGAKGLARALEKEFGMPFVKIKQKFEDMGVPLGRVVKRGLMEQLKRRKKV